MGDKFEGSLAKAARTINEHMADGNVQVIFIATDVTGKTPTHVHMQGPSKDRVLIGGMLSEAGRIIMSTIDDHRKQQAAKIKELEERIASLEKS